MSLTVSHKIAHYLLALEAMGRRHGYAKTSDVAKELGISRTAAHLALKNLTKKGLAFEDERHCFHLTDEARERAVQIRGTYSVAEKFFSAILHLPEDEAKENACQIEHHLSPNASKKLLMLMRFLLEAPHGRRIIERINQIEEEECRHNGHCEICEMIDDCPLTAITGEAV